MQNISLLVILIISLAGFAGDSTGKVSEMKTFQSMFDSPKAIPSNDKMEISSKPDSDYSIEAVDPDLPPANSEMSFSAVDGSRALPDGMQPQDGMKNIEQKIEARKRLPSIYIEKYRE